MLKINQILKWFLVRYFSNIKLSEYFHSIGKFKYIIFFEIKSVRKTLSVCIKTSNFTKLVFQFCQIGKFHKNIHINNFRPFFPFFEILIYFDITLTLLLSTRMQFIVFSTHRCMWRFEKYYVSNHFFLLRIHNTWLLKV